MFCVFMQLLFRSACSLAFLLRKGKSIFESSKHFWVSSCLKVGMLFRTQGPEGQFYLCSGSTPGVVYVAWLRICSSNQSMNIDYLRL